MELDHNILKRMQILRDAFYKMHYTIEFNILRTLQILFFTNIADCTLSSTHRVEKSEKEKMKKIIALAKGG